MKDSKDSCAIKDVDYTFMRMAIAEAEKGLGRTSPNPAVGCVLVRDGEVVGRGYHKKAGTPHAEIHALADAGALARGAIAYVTLEPCSHTGRTGPCCEALAQAGVARVVIGQMDPNPLVNGRGARYLADHGVEVVSGVLEKECYELVRDFIKKIKTGLPLVVMKAGVSLDGRLNYQEGKPGWITGAESKAFTHGLRNRYDAILVGRSTLEIDNPSLTCRIEGGRDPIPVVLDTNLSIDPKAKIFQDASQKPIIFCKEGVDVARKDVFKGIADLIEVGCKDGSLSLQDVLLALGKRDINSVLVEGGARIHASFLNQKLYDYAYLFHAAIFAGDSGVPLLRGCNVQDREGGIRLLSPLYTQLGEDMLVQGELLYP